MKKQERFPCKHPSYAPANPGQGGRHTPMPRILGIILRKCHCFPTAQGVEFKAIYFGTQAQ